MKILRNERGQGVVEIVLLLAITVSLGLVFTRYMEQSQFAQKLFGNPWKTLAGMMECGSWKGCGNGQHPNSMSRVLSLRPNE